ncbi:MAG: ribokinase [Thermomicrobiales bacterium]|jgi:ribokinase|nr:ribokinase [Thermomicrobiales bacterium]
MGADAPAGVCVVGSVHMDVVATADRLPAAGESVVGHRVALSPGGKAGNQAAQAALNGARTFLIGRVGRDVFGDQLRGALARTGVDTTYLIADAQEATGISPVFTGADGEYASIIVPGAGQRLQAEDIEAARDAFARSAVLLIQGEIPIQLSAHAARLARSLGGRVIFNASPAPADAAAIPDDLWSAVDVLLVNATEAERLSGMPVAGVPAAVMAGEALQRRLGIPTVIMTLGGLGAIALDERGTRHLPSWPVPVVETIGAGDAFAGVLASELARGRQLDEALPLANAAGALAVTRPGAHDALPTGAHIQAFLKEGQRETLPGE